MTESDSAQLTQLREDVAALKSKLEHPSKDVWDRFTALSGLLSGLAVAAIGAYATQLYNARQQELQRARDLAEISVQRVQTVEKFFPHLTSGNESQKEAALLIIGVLGDDSLPIQLAKVLGGTGSRAALSAFALGADSTAARTALGALYATAQPSVVRILLRGRVFVATGFFVRTDGMLVTTAHVARGLQNDVPLVRLASGDTVSATIVRVDTLHDLALLQAHVTAPVAPLRPGLAELTVDLQVIALGHTPAGWVPKVGNVIDVNASLEMGGLDFGPRTLTNRILTTDISEPGFSGAPVVNTDGALVGVLEGGKPGESSILIPARILIDALGLAPPTRETGQSVH
jgi:S1-C subfamily serine protease